MYDSIFEFFSQLYSSKKTTTYVAVDGLVDINQVIRKQRILNIVRAYGELWREFGISE